MIRPIKSIRIPFLALCRLKRSFCQGMWFFCFKLTDTGWKYQSLENHACQILFTDKALPTTRRRCQFAEKKYCLVVWKWWYPVLSHRCYMCSCFSYQILFTDKALPAIRRRGQSERKKFLLIWKLWYLLCAKSEMLRMQLVSYSNIHTWIGTMLPAIKAAAHWLRGLRQEWGFFAAYHRSRSSQSECRMLRMISTKGISSFGHSRQSDCRVTERIPASVWQSGCRLHPLVT